MVSGTGCVPGVSGDAQDSPSSVFQRATCPGHSTVSHPLHGLCEFYRGCITLVRKGLAGPGHIVLIPQKTLTDYVPMSILQRARGDLFLPEITQLTGGQLRMCILARARTAGVLFVLQKVPATLSPVCLSISLSGP